MQRTAAHVADAAKQMRVLAEAAVQATKSTDGWIGALRTEVSLVPSIFFFLSSFFCHLPFIFPTVFLLLGIRLIFFFFYLFLSNFRKNWGIRVVIFVSFDLFALLSLLLKLSLYS